MSAGKTEFKISFNVPKEDVNRVIQQYLMANGFEQQQNGNTYFYYSRRNGSLRTFEYYLNDYELLVLAYLGTFEKPQKLEGMLEGFQKQNYRNEIMTLFGEINKIGQYQQTPNTQMYEMPISDMQMPYGSNMGNTGYANTNSTNANVFIEENERKKERRTIVGFIVAIIGLLIACAGVSYGAIIIFWELWCASQGLNTKKRGFAIATIVMAVINLIILILGTIGKMIS